MHWVISLCYDERERKRKLRLGGLQVKKVFMLLEVIILTFMSFSVLAVDQTIAERSKIPEIKTYRVMATSRKGIDYYKNYEAVGKIGANTELEVNRESIVEGVAYSFFRLIGDERQSEYSVKSSDVQVVDEVAIAPSNLESKKSFVVKVLAEDGVVLHKGPGNAYTTINKVPKGTELTVYRDENYPGPWLYTSHRGKNGWICELNGAIGREPEVHHRIMAPNTIPIYANTVSDTVVGTVPASTRISSFLYVDEWSNRYYVDFRGITGYVIPEECAWSKIAEGTYKKKVDFGSTKLYETADIHSKVLVDEIPIGTVLSYEFATSFIEDGWVYTKQSGVTGWAYIFATEEAYQKNLEEIQKIEENPTQENPNTNEETTSGEEITTNVSGNQQTNSDISNGNDIENNTDNNNNNNNNSSNQNSDKKEENPVANKNPFAFSGIQFGILITSILIVIILTSSVTMMIMKKRR